MKAEGEDDYEAAEDSTFFESFLEEAARLEMFRKGERE